MVGLLSIIAPLWVECSFLFFFILGFVFRRFNLFRRYKAIRAKCPDEPRFASFSQTLRKDIEAKSVANDPAAVLAAWRIGKTCAATPLELLKLIVQAFIDVEPESLIGEIVGHMEHHIAQLGNSRVASVVLETVARNGCTKTLFGLWDAVDEKLGVQPNYNIYEALIHGYALDGNSEKVNNMFAILHEEFMRPTARCYSLIIKGYLKNSMIEPTLEQMRMMKQQGFYVPPFAITQVFRIACDTGRAVEVFASFKQISTLSNEAVQLLLEDCVKRNDLTFATRVEQTARDTGVTFTCSSYDSLLRLLTNAGDLRALQVFDELQSSSYRVGEGMCVGLLARCAETKFLKFAEEIVCHVRSQDRMSIAVYSALMKVYAYSGMYDRACDLYDSIREDNLEPDAMMYGCLMKFAVECGRTELSRELSERAPCLDIQNYMSLIRAAGRDKDVGQAFAVLKKLKNSGVAPDLAAYNCVLDVCVSAGDTNSVRRLLDEMRSISPLDVVTYNILLKRYCTTSDVHGARAMMAEMRQDGVRPDDVSYNCLINVTLSSGNFRDAWALVEKMESDGVKVDHYTIAILMKALKQSKNRSDVERALLLLDQSGLDICSDEIMFNTILEMCIKHRECGRLQAALRALSTSNLRPSVHTYGSLIKACGALKQLDRSWAFWREMIEERSIEPNDVVLGCMLDALVCNNHIDDAVALLELWKGKVPLTMVICSTILKGFANTRQAPRAMAMWREVRQSGLPMNTVVYNVTIDAHARVGAMDGVSELVEAMAADGCEPDGITYSTIVKGYCVKGDLDKAFDVFSNMKTGNPDNDAIVYNTVLDGCTRHGRWDIADKVLADMERNKIKPSIFTLGSLIKMYGRRRQLDKAFKVFEEYPKKHGFVRNQQVSTCLMCACLNNNALDKALMVFEDLKVSFQGPDSKAYGAMITGCVRHGKLQVAIGLVEEAYGIKEKDTDGQQFRGLPKGQRLEIDPIELLFKALQQHGQMDTLGATLINKLRAANAPINGRLLNSLFEGSTPSKGSTLRHGGSHYNQKRGK